MQELRLQFLHCRENYMVEVIDDLEEQGAYDYLKRLTDIHRLHLFDVVMQYRAIFSDDHSAQVSSQLHPTSVLCPPQPPTPPILPPRHCPLSVQSSGLASTSALHQVFG